MRRTSRVHAVSSPRFIPLSDVRVSNAHDQTKAQAGNSGHVKTNNKVRNRFDKEKVYTTHPVFSFGVEFGFQTTASLANTLVLPRLYARTIPDHLLKSEAKTFQLMHEPVGTCIENVIGQRSENGCPQNPY